MSPYGFMPPGEPRFGELGEAYDTYRVGYTPMVYEYLARVCGLGAGIDVVDLGCGTGLSTRPLVERAANVVAVDADAEMLAIAARHLHGSARLVHGRAEALPLPDASADLVVAAQAAHWFEEPDATDEIRRVLRPGGAVAYLWKYPAPETPYTYLVDELMTLITNEPIRTMYGIGTVPDLLRPYWQDYRREVFDQPVAYTVESYVGFISSRDRVRQVIGARRDALLEALGDRLRDLEPSGAFVERNLAYVVTARSVE
jgi:ubiquinone/menaquinone biosynthesis C-methylase UbiE